MMAASARPMTTYFMRDYLRGLVLLLATVAGIAIAARLGFWQLGRADQKEALQSALDARSRLPPLDARSLAKDVREAEQQHFRPVVVSGRWRADRTVFLDNRQMDGKPGFFVVTPLAIDGRPEAVLVQRGWVPRNFIDRTQLPAVDAPAGQVTVIGSVAPSPGRMFQFDGAESGPIRQNIDLAAFASEARLDLLPLTILQRDETGVALDGLSRRWAAPASDVQKHYGYAFQWFAIATGILCLYVWHRFIRPRSRHR